MMMSQFRRSVIADTKKKTGGSGSGWRGSFFDRFRLPQAPQPPTPFVILKTEFTDPNPSSDLVEIDPRTKQPLPVRNPYFKAKRHRRALKKGMKERYAEEVCSAGTNPHNPQPCAGCYAMEKGDRSVSLSDFFVFSIFHLVPYHTYPAIDKNTGGYLTKKDGNPILNSQECTGRSCNFCRVLSGNAPILRPNENWGGWDANVISTVFGKQRYIDVGKGHLENIVGWNDAISSACGTCGGTLVTDSFSCPHCNHKAIDMAQDPRSDTEIGQAVSRPYPCPRCQVGVLLREQLVCEACESANRPQSVLTLNDVVLVGGRQGEKQKSHLVLSTMKPFIRFEEFEKSVDPRFLNGRTIAQYIAENTKPYDFGSMFKPRSLEEQARNLEVEVPGHRGVDNAPPFIPYE